MPPIVLIVGAQKCGTTSLHDSLAKHRGIRNPSKSADGTPVKELDFFDLNWSRGLEWYAAKFSKGRGPFLDSTPNYLCRLECHARMATAFPEAQILVSLRDPVERAYSAYNHYMQDMPSTQAWDWERPGESFARNVEAELDAHDPAHPSTMGLVGRGHYAVQLRSLLRHFPQERIRVVIMERWTQEPRKLHRQILHDLGLGPRRLPNKHRHLRAKSVPAMDEPTRARLAAHFSLHNAQLEAIVGGRIQEWQSAQAQEGASAGANRWNS